jgi:hypothetical protein
LTSWARNVYPAAIQGLDLGTTTLSEWPYIAAGYTLRAHDVNEDGFEDVLALLAYYEGYAGKADIIVFINPNNESTNGTIPFIYNQQFAKIIAWDHSFDYTFQLCDVNIDGKMDLVTATCALSENCLGKTPIKAAYYFSLHQNWSSFPSIYY